MKNNHVMEKASILTITGIIYTVMNTFGAANLLQTHPEGWHLCVCSNKLHICIMIKILQ